MMASATLKCLVETFDSSVFLEGILSRVRKFSKYFYFSRTRNSLKISRILDNEP